MNVEQLHVHPTSQRARLGYIESRGDPLGTVNAGADSSLMGIRAQMLYIHGRSSDWEGEELKQWLQEAALTRLVDSCPARVVWLNDG